MNRALLWLAPGIAALLLPGAASAQRQGQWPFLMQQQMQLQIQWQQQQQQQMQTQLAQRQMQAWNTPATGQWGVPADPGRSDWSPQAGGAGRIGMTRRPREIWHRYVAPDLHYTADVHRYVAPDLHYTAHWHRYVAPDLRYHYHPTRSRGTVRLLTTSTFALSTSRQTLQTSTNSLTGSRNVTGLTDQDPLKRRQATARRNQGGTRRPTPTAAHRHEPNSNRPTTQGDANRRRAVVTPRPRATNTEQKAAQRKKESSEQHRPTVQLRVSMTSRCGTCHECKQNQQSISRLPQRSPLVTDRRVRRDRTDPAPAVRQPRQPMRLVVGNPPSRQRREPPRPGQGSRS